MYYEVTIRSEAGGRLEYKYCETVACLYDLQEYDVISIFLVDANGFHINVTELLKEILL